MSQNRSGRPIEPEKSDELLRAEPSPRPSVDRRTLLASAATVLTAAALSPLPAHAARTTVEQSNLQTVHDFNEAMQARSWDRFASLLAEEAVLRYRQRTAGEETSGATPLGGEVTGRVEITDLLKQILAPVQAFDYEIVREGTLGPFVFHERTETLKDDEGTRYVINSVMYLLENGQIVEWFELVLSAQLEDVEAFLAAR